jgi:glycerol-3-phosphate dehydrogenase
MESLGQNFGGGLYEREVIYLIENEWAETVEDILWRRSKKGLRVPDSSKIDLQRFIEQYKSVNNSLGTP